MALEYFLYTTEYNNTLVDRSETSFAPLPPNTGEILIDFFIPKIQPLYYYRESGGTIVLNDETTINTYLIDTTPVAGQDYATVDQLGAATSGVTQQEFNAYTAQTDIEITAVENAIISVDNNVSFISGVTDTKLDNAEFTGYTANTATKRILLVNNTIQDLNTIAGINIQWDIEIRKDSDFFEHNPNSTDITILQTGLYDISLSVPMNYAGGGNQVNNVAIVVLVNGNTNIDSFISATINKDRQQTASLAPVEFQLNAGDVIQVEGYSLNGTTQAVTVAGSVWVQITKVNS